VSSAAPMPRHEAAALLGVPEDATSAQVQRAYLRAARTTHPDVLPEADEAGRRAAAAAFDRLTRARDTLIGSPARVPTPSAVRSGGDVATPRWGSRERGLGGSLVVLALLAFLLIGIVSAEQALRGGMNDLPQSTQAP
jgi:hypothetical protein